VARIEGKAQQGCQGLVAHRELPANQSATLRVGFGVVLSDSGYLEFQLLGRCGLRQPPSFAELRRWQAPISTQLRRCVAYTTLLARIISQTLLHACGLSSICMPGGNRGPRRRQPEIAFCWNRSAASVARVKGPGSGKRVGTQPTGPTSVAGHTWFRLLTSPCAHAFNRLVRHKAIVQIVPDAYRITDHGRDILKRFPQDAGGQDL
jgi:hypothetical protein